MNDHANLTGNHNPFGNVFANESERISYPYTDQDLHKMYLQLSDNSLWVLLQVDPYLIFTQANGSGGGGGGAGNYKFITEAIISDDAEVQFDNLVISSEYDHYIFELIDIRSSSDNVELSLLCSSDNGSNWISTGYGHSLWRVYQSGSSSAQSNSGQSKYSISLDSGSLSRERTNGRVELLNANSDGEKFFVQNIAAIAENGEYKSVIGSAFCDETDPVNAIKFYFSSGNILSGKIRVYAITKTVSEEEASANNTIVVATSGDSVIYENSSSEADIITATPIGPMNANSSVRIHMNADINHTIAGTLTLRIKLGTDTLLTLSISEGTTSALKESFIDVHISNMNSTNVQKSRGLVQMKDAPTQIRSVWATGDANVDTTTEKDLRVTGQWNTADAGLVFTLYSYTVELLK